MRNITPTKCFKLYFSKKKKISDVKIWKKFKVNDFLINLFSNQANSKGQHSKSFDLFAKRTMKSINNTAPSKWKLVMVSIILCCTCAFKMTNNIFNLQENRTDNNNNNFYSFIFQQTIDPIHQIINYILPNILIQIKWKLSTF